MTCISPPEPEDRLLMAFLDGEADPEITLHLNECLHCRDRVDSLAQEQRLLTSRLFRITCPSSTDLGEYHLHLLSPDQTLMVSQHLRHCPYCSQEIAQLDEFLSDIAPSSQNNLLQPIKVLIAQLVGAASGPIGEPSFAFRGKSEDPMTFEVGGNLIVIDIQQTSNGKLNLLGQVASVQQDAWTDATVKLKHDDQPERKTTVDDLGTFRFENLIPGSMELKIESRGGTVIVVPTFEG